MTAKARISTSLHSCSCKKRIHHFKVVHSKTGVVFYMPFVGRVVKTSLQLNDIELSISLPSKEGLSVTAQISILYRIDPNMVPSLIRNLGLEHRNIISNIFRSASADVCSE